MTEGECGTKIGDLRSIRVVGSGNPPTGKVETGPQGYALALPYRRWGLGRKVEELSGEGFGEGLAGVVAPFPIAVDDEVGDAEFACPGDEFFAVGGIFFDVANFVGDALIVEEFLEVLTIAAKLC